MSQTFDFNERPDYDEVLQWIANYVLTYSIDSEEAWNTARYCLMDTIGCGMLALRFPECTKHLGPMVDGTIVPNGARVPGTSFRLDPVKAAWDIGCIVRWLDFNDTWLAAEWGHPSDNLGAILAVADHLSQKQISEDKAPLTTRTVLEAMIMAHEIQGVLALENSFNRVGLDHVVLVKVASTAVVAKLLGANREQLLSACRTPGLMDKRYEPTGTHLMPDPENPGLQGMLPPELCGWRISPCVVRWEYQELLPPLNGGFTMCCSAKPIKTKN